MRTAPEGPSPSARAALDESQDGEPGQGPPATRTGKKPDEGAPTPGLLGRRGRSSRVAPASLPTTGASSGRSSRWPGRRASGPRHGEGLGAERRLDDLEGEGPPEPEHQRAPGSSSVQANTPAAARAASGRTSGRINCRQTWRRLAPTNRAASSQAGPTCATHRAEAIATRGTPPASPSQIQPSQPPQSIGVIQPRPRSSARLRRPSSPLSPMAPNTGGITRARGSTRRAVAAPRTASARIPARPTPTASDPIATTLATATLFQRQSQTNGSHNASAIGNAETRTTPVGPRSSNAAGISPNDRDQRDEPESHRRPAPSPRIESMPMIPKR